MARVLVRCLVGGLFIGVRRFLRVLVVDSWGMVGLRQLVVGWLVKWLVGSLTEIDPLVDRSVDRSVGRSVGSSVGGSVGRSVGRSVGQTVGRSNGRWVNTHQWLVILSMRSSGLMRSVMTSPIGAVSVTLLLGWCSVSACSWWRLVICVRLFVFLF